MIADIKTLRGAIQTRINTHLEKTSTKAWEKYKERINKLAFEDPSRFLRYIREDTAGPTDTANTTQGMVTSITELSTEAQRHLQSSLSTPLEDNPLGDPQQPIQPDQATQTDQQTRRTFIGHLLENHAPRIEPTAQLDFTALMQPTTTEEITKVIKRSKRGATSPGLRMPLFKELPTEGLQLLTHIVNRILRNPTEMPKSELLNHIILLPKADPHDLSKVRPITLSTVLNKLIDKLIADRIGTLIQKHHLLHPANVGFIPEGETHDLILPLQMAFDAAQGSTYPQYPKPLYALQIDWTGAFDRMPWELTNMVLRHLHFPETLITWLEVERRHSTTHMKFPQGIDPEPIQFTPTRGTKQGSGLSPILFAITNDLLVRWLASETTGTWIGNTHLTSLTYADDMSILTECKHNLQRIIEMIEIWEHTTGQKMNAEKTEILTNTPNLQPQTLYNGAPLKEVTHFKYLGAIVKAIPSKTYARDPTTHLLTKKIEKFQQRLAKLHSLPLSTPSKAAVIKSAIVSLLPYAMYMLPPEAIPLKQLQVQLMQVLKGSPKHKHLANSVIHSAATTHKYPNLPTDLPLQLFLDLHRILNTNSLASDVTQSYFALIQQQHHWPTNPLDPIVSSTPLHLGWRGTLAHTWRTWQKHMQPTAQIHLISTHSKLNPAGCWTNIFTSSAMNNQSTTINRTTHVLPPDTQKLLAQMQIFHPSQLRRLTDSQWAMLGTPATRHLRQIQQGTPEYTPLPDPWDVDHEEIQATHNYSAADGGMENGRMAAGIVIGDPTIIEEESPPGCHRLSHPVYGYMSSAAAEMGGLESTIIRAARWHRQHPQEQWHHAQDNQGIVKTFQKLTQAKSPWEIPGYLIKNQAQRCAWRRILHREPHIGKWFECKWKKGHAANPDINAADALATEALERQTYTPTTQPPPVFQLGMDDFSLIITYEAQYRVNVAHPQAGNQSTLVTLLHDGKRKHLQNLWSHIHSQQLGAQSATYHTVHTTTKDIRTYHLKTTQIGYQVLPKRTNKAKPPDPATSKPPKDTTDRNYHTTWYTSDIQLINNLRAGLWNVHERTITKQPGFRWCKHCDAMATLHHVLCDCTHTRILAARGLAISKLNHLMHNPKLTCEKEHLHPPITPTNMANTKWSRPMIQTSKPPPTTQSPSKPLTCLQQWLGLIPQQIPTSPELIQNLKTLMQGTVAMIHAWMDMVPTNTHLKPESDLFQHVPSVKLHPQKPRTTTHKPIQPIPYAKPWQTLAKTCAHQGCLRKTKSAYGRCYSHQTPTMRRTHPRHQPDPQPQPPQTPRQIMPLTQAIPSNVIITFPQPPQQPIPPPPPENPWEIFLQDLDTPEPPPTNPHINPTPKSPPTRLPPPTPAQIQQFKTNSRRRAKHTALRSNTPDHPNPPNVELALQLHHLCRSAQALPTQETPPTRKRKQRPHHPIHSKKSRPNNQVELPTPQLSKSKRTASPIHRTPKKHRHNSNQSKRGEEVAGLPTHPQTTLTHAYP
jgi:ribonuclease HI